jgi:50S ribosomal protein L16 3-hydroxylase
VDSYDVFLLQGQGKRRWQLSRQEDHAFIPGLDLRILERFEPQSEWVLEAGDMLYLPPGVAHHGVAESECLTWSIGFRAPSDRELVTGFLDFLHEKLEPAGHYADPGASPARHPGEVPAALEAHVERVLDAIRWTPEQAREFTGRYLSEPKASVYFTPPLKPLSRRRFAQVAAARGLALDPRARLLFSGTMFFVNGETVLAAAGARSTLRRLADERRLAAPVKAGAPFWDTAHAWYLQGFVQIEGEEEQ